MNKSNLEQGALSLSCSGCISTKGEGVAHSGQVEVAPQVGGDDENMQPTPAKEASSSGESQRMHRSMDRKKKEFSKPFLLPSLPMRPCLLSLYLRQIFFFHEHTFSFPVQWKP